LKRALPINRHVAQRMGFTGITLMAIATVLPIVAVVIYILIQGLPAISLEFLTGFPHDGMRAGGILPAIIGTIYLTVGTAIFSVPLGIAAAIYLSEYAGDTPLTRTIRIAIINLAGIPSVVYGLFGLGLFVLFLNFGTSILAASLTLSIMTLPVIISTAEESLRSVPQAFRTVSISLGATRWQTIWRVTLPAARSGVLTAVMLGVGRAIGETMTVMMVTGNAPVLAVKLGSLFSPVRTMTATIAAEMGEVANGSTHYHVLFFIGMVLFLISLGVNIAASSVVFRAKKRAERILS